MGLFKDKSRQKRALSLNLAYQNTFSTEDGQTVLKDLMISTGYDGTSFVPHDSHQTAFNEGARSMVVRIVKTLAMDPEAFMKMLEDIEEDKEVLDV